MKKTTAKDITAELLELFYGVKDDKVIFQKATTMVSTAGKVLSVKRLQQSVARQTGRAVPKDVLEFCED